MSLTLRKYQEMLMFSLITDHQSYSSPITVVLTQDIFRYPVALPYPSLLEMKPWLSIKAQRNLGRWVSRNIVPQNDWF